MQTAKKDYYLDEDGKIVTDAKKGVRRLVRKGSAIRADVARIYGFTDGEAKLGKIAEEDKSAVPATENKSSVSIKKAGDK